MSTKNLQTAFNNKSIDQNQITVYIRNFQQTRTYPIDKSLSLLDLLEMLINKEPLYSYSAFTISISYNRVPIIIQNATTKIEEYLDSEHTNLTLFESNCLNPKNDLLKAINIIKIHKYNLQDTVNLNDVDCINLANIGTWNGFGRGPMTVPKEDDNHLENLVFIKKGDVIRAYNIYALLKARSTSSELKIPIFQHDLDELRIIKMFDNYMTQTRIFQGLAEDNFQLVNLNDTNFES